MSPKSNNKAGGLQDAPLLEEEQKPAAAATPTTATPTTALTRLETVDNEETRRIAMELAMRSAEARFGGKVQTTILEEEHATTTEGGDDDGKNDKKSDATTNIASAADDMLVVETPTSPVPLKARYDAEVVPPTPPPVPTGKLSAASSSGVMSSPIPGPSRAASRVSTPGAVSIRSPFSTDDNATLAQQTAATDVEDPPPLSRQEQVLQEGTTHMVPNATLVKEGGDDDENEKTATLVEASPALEGFQAILANRRFKEIAVAFVLVLIVTVVLTATLVPSGSGIIDLELQCGSHLVNQADYRGTISVTEEGYKCQRWDSQTPHEHDFGSEEYSTQLQENYCRNPDGDRRA